MLLKDYEGTLESVMARFRTFAHSTQEHDLQLARHYESLLESDNRRKPIKTGESNEIPLLEDPVAVQESLFRLTHLLRKALRASQGEDVHSDTSTPSEPDDAAQSVGYGVPPLDQINAKLGGYLALLGAKAHRSKGFNGIDDDALERQVEMERLRTENDLLRRMLVAAGDDPLLASPSLV